MKAYKCDRCGTLYETNKTVSNMKITVDTPTTLTWQDLCPECQKAFDEWLNTYKEKEVDAS